MPPCRGAGTTPANSQTSAQRPPMASQKPTRPKARLPRGFRDRGAAEIMAEQKMLAARHLMEERLEVLEVQLDA